MPRPNDPTLPRRVLKSLSPPLKTRGVYANVKLEPVAFDPAVDCPPYACFNCRVKDVHINKDCLKPVLYKYCENCGRRGLDVYKCPRCSKGYIEQFGGKPYAHVEAQESLVEVPKMLERKLPVGMTPLPPKSKKKKRAKKTSSSSSQTSSEKNAVVKTHNFPSTSDSTVESELGDQSFNDVEDLDNMVFDEDLDSIVFDEGETPLLLQHTNDAFQAIMTLIEATKDLSLEDKNKILVEFIQAQELALKS